MEARQDSDKLAWDWIDALWEEAVKHVQLSSICRKIESFVKRTFGQTATLLLPMVIGGFNVLYPIKIEGRSGNVLVRMPCLNQAVFPVEKTLAEAATVAYVDQRTHLRAPRVFHHGVDSDIGPFMIIEDLGSRRGMGQALEAPRENLNNPAVLQPDISKAKLNSLYVEMARCVLQSAQPRFPRIGDLAEVTPGSYSISGRPMTLNMNNMVQLQTFRNRYFRSKERPVRLLMSGAQYWLKCK